MPATFFEIDDKPAYRIDQVPGIPFVLEFNDDQEQEWVPNYDAGFSRKAVPIGAEEFKKLAGDMAQRIRPAA